MDTPIYIDTYFRVESGYDGGRMPEEKAGRFFDEVKRLFTETPMKCPFCEGENSNARVYEDKQNKEYFVYCPKCGIETKDTFTSKAKAVKAFAEGKTKKVTGSEVADE